MYTNTHACMHPRSINQLDMHKPPASIFHYYNAISWRQGWVVFRCTCTVAECARWAVIDSLTQTRVSAKAYSKDPAGSRRGAVSSVV